jgi:hypothetical protein
MNQSEKVLEYIKQNGSITSLEAIREIGCTRLSARIKDLEDMGNIFHRERVTVSTRDGKTTVTQYSLIREAVHG